MTTKGRQYPTRVSCRFRGKAGQVVLDQIRTDQTRTVDTARMVRKPGQLGADTGAKVLAVLCEIATALSPD